MGIEGYKTVELPDCCIVCKWLYSDSLNRQCRREDRRLMASDARDMRSMFVSFNGWCPKFERDEP